MSQKQNILFCCMLLFTVIFLLAGCGGGGGGVISVDITPAGPLTLTINQSQTFSAMVNGSANQVVHWSADGGNITNAGVYTAPAIAGTYHITGIADADSTKQTTVTVIVQPVIISVDISPSGPVSLTINQSQSFSAAVNGSANQLVHWSADGGNITNAGVYTAPVIAGTYHVTVIADADSTKQATVTIVVQTTDSNVLIQ